MRTNKNARKALRENSRDTPVHAAVRFLLGDASMFALLGSFLLPDSAPFWGASDYFYSTLPEIPIRFIYGISYGLFPAIGAYAGILFAAKIWPGHKYQAWVFVLTGAIAAGLRYGMWPQQRLFFNYLVPAALAWFATFLIRRWKAENP